MKGALLVAGTTSDAGKSALVAGICRMLARRGVRVAPFKAQNMSNNSVVTSDGGEIGRAQAMQAHACGLAPSTAFNPVLLKPGSDRSSQVVVLGKVAGTVSARSYHERRSALLETVVDTLTDLRTRYDVVVCEGAGSPAEINLRGSDIANMGLAQAADLPVVVVGDIDRGGVLAHLFGTLAVLDAADQARIAGFVINKFRGDPGLLAPGLDQLRALTGRPMLGVVPWADGLWLDAEGLGLLDLEIEFDVDKHLGNPTGVAWGEPVAGYEIHHGRVVRSGDPGLIGAEGSDTDRVWGTHRHGLLENDAFRRRLLDRVGRDGFVAAPDTSFAAERTAQLDLLGDLVEQNLDVCTLDQVIGHGAPRDLPIVTSGLAVSHR